MTNRRKSTTFLSEWLDVNEQSASRDDEGVGKCANESDSLIPLSQAWIYKFYYEFEHIFNVNQKSIIDAVLRGLGFPEEMVAKSEASKKQITAAVQIIRSVLSRSGINES